MKRVNPFGHRVDFPAVLIGEGRFGLSLRSSLTRLDNDRIRHWMFLEEFGTGTLGPIEATGAARDLHD